MVSSSGQVLSGQWTWYRSMTSVRRRLRLSSHSSRMDSGRRFGIRCRACRRSWPCQLAVAFGAIHRIPHLRPG